jgi:dTDP-4-dehydrorhamnose reductase
LSCHKILVTGIGGLLGPYLAEKGQTFGTVYGLGRNSGNVRCDLTDSIATKSAIANISPTIVIHAAALTNVDLCETHPEEASKQNILATKNIVASLPARTRLVYLSSDQVYPNTKGPHSEGTEQPINEYGRSKLAGEAEALRHFNTIALRTNMFGPSITNGRHSLSDFIINNMATGAATTLFRDILFSPLYIGTLTELIWKLAFMDCQGAYNLGSRDGLTKAEFGLAIATKKKLTLKNVSIGSSTNMANRAKRASDLRMDVTSIESLLGLKMPTVLEEIEKL